MTNNFLILIAIYIFSVISEAIPESQISEKFMSGLVPYVLKTYQRDSFTGIDAVKIIYYYKQVVNPKGVIIISPGQSESSLKYSELLYDLKESGYSIYIIDHRGQGESGRMLPDPVKSYVRNFSDYVDDFNYFMTNVIKPAQYKHSFIIAHSMGGAIASGFLRQNPKAVTAVILTAPMLEIDSGILGGLGADVLANILDYSGFSKSYAPTQKPYDPQAKFETNKVTSSRERYNMRINLYNTYPQLQVGGTTVNWVKESLEYTAILRNTENIFQVPTLLFQAGRDQKVLPHGQNIACEELSPKFCRIFHFPDAQHEILMEVDSIRDSALAAIRQYINYFETN